LSDDGDSATLQAYVPSANGVKTYSMPSKLKYNGESMDVANVVQKLRDGSVIPEEGLPDTGDIKTAGANASQVARIVVSGSEIEEIVTSKVYDENNNTTEDSSVLVPYSELKGKTTYKGSNNFDGKFYINSSTTIIYVPADRAKTNSYSKKTASNFSSGSSYIVYPYNVNSSKVANLVLMFGTTGSSTKASGHLWVAASDSYSAFESGDEIYNIDVFPNSVTKSTKKAEIENIITTGDLIVDVGDLTYGDIFRAGTESSSKLVNAERIFAYNDVLGAIDNGADFTKKSFEWEPETSTSMSAYVYNVIEVLEDGGKYSLRLTRDPIVEDGSDYEETNLAVESDTIVFRVDKDNEEVTPYAEGSDSEMITVDTLNEAAYSGVDCSKIAVYMYGSSKTTRKCKFILIYE